MLFPDLHVIRKINGELQFFMQNNTVPAVMKHTTRRKSTRTTRRTSSVDLRTAAKVRAMDLTLRMAR